jgi:hypothetical protein
MKYSLVLLINLTIIHHCFAQQTNNWFAFKPSGQQAGSVLNMEHWLDKPAGKHGFVRSINDEFIFEDGSPVKFWGTNISSDLPFMDHQSASTWASFLAGFGFNGVRFHKFTWDATDGIHSTRLTDANWKNFDFLCNELRNKGIYYGWSHIYGHRVRPADSTRMLSYREIATTNFPWAHLNGTTSALVNFADDLQEINIELTINMLNHVNPYTGLRYADDPALSFIEMQNEDNIYWAAIEKSLEQAPTYRKLLCKKFSSWLKNKYGNQSALEKAWQGEGISKKEHMEHGTMYPQPNHGLFSWEYSQAIKENRKVKQHILDKAQFLYEEQLNYYRKFEAAIRKAGYKGPLIGSCWQAGSGLTHLLNLHADAQVGFVDRHNYFGGGAGHNLQPGPFINSAMVSKPGTGLLSSGLQQIKDRPFAFSEWMSLIPNEWTAESAPLIAAYGMGLQGWDASYVFATDIPGYQPTIHAGEWGGIYNANTPTQLALYPALASMIYRKDVNEGATVVDRKVHLPDLLKGATPINESVEQDWDQKNIESQFPPEYMAIGKVVVSFANENKVSIADNISNYQTEGVLTATTNQLKWYKTGKGYFTINTPGTKGIVGFHGPGENELGELTIRTTNDFSVILVSSLDKTKGIAESGKILVTTIARAQNSGMKYSENRSELLARGTAPVLLEPVTASLHLNRKGNCTITILDHSGNKTKQQLAITNGWIPIDGAATKAIYYLIEWME